MNVLNYNKNLYIINFLYFQLFKEKTGQEWNNRRNFKKQPGKHNLIQIREDFDIMNVMEKNDITSDLPYKIQELISFIFDKNRLASTVIYLEVNQ